MSDLVQTLLERRSNLDRELSELQQDTTQFLTQRVTEENRIQHRDKLNSVIVNLENKKELFYGVLQDLKQALYDDKLWDNAAKQRHDVDEVLVGNVQQTINLLKQRRADLDEDPDISFNTPTKERLNPESKSSVDHSMQNIPAPEQKSSCSFN